jgi:hypothetical protein
MVRQAVHAFWKNMDRQIGTVLYVLALVVPYSTVQDSI